MSSPSRFSPSKEHGKLQQRNDRNQRQPNQHVRLNETGQGKGNEDEEEKRKEEHGLRSAITSASHSQLSHILLDFCRHSKTAVELTRSHLCQPEGPVAAAVPIPAVPTLRNPNEASKKPIVLRSILKKSKDGTSSSSSSGEVFWSPPQRDDHASPSLGGISLPPRLPSVAFSPVLKTSETSNSNSSKSSSNSDSKSNSNSSNSSKSSSSSNSSSSSISKGKNDKSRTSPAPENDAHNSKKRKGPTPTPTRCRNCGSEYNNTTPQSSPSRDGPATTVGENEGEVCIHHTGEREVQPSHAVWEDFDPDLHGDAWTLMEYEAFACGFRWSCCKREVGERGCVVAKRHEAAPVPLAMPMWKRARR